MQDILGTVRANATGKTGPVAVYAIQGYCPDCDKDVSLRRRFFAPSPTRPQSDATNRASRVGGAEGMRPQRFLAEIGIALRIHDAHAQRRHSQPRLHALVEDVQPATTAVHAASLRAIVRRRVAASRVRAGGFPTVPAEPEHVLYLGYRIRQACSQHEQRELSSEVDDGGELCFCEPWSWKLAIAVRKPARRDRLAARSLRVGA